MKYLAFGLLSLLLVVACSLADETGVCTRVESVTADGEVIFIDLTGCLVVYNTNDWTGTLLTLDMGTNGNVSAGSVTLSDPVGTKWAVTVSTNGTLITTEVGE